MIFILEVSLSVFINLETLLHGLILSHSSGYKTPGDIAVELKYCGVHKKELVTHTYDIDIGSDGDRAIKTAALQALARQGVYADTVYMCESPGVSVSAS